MGNGPPPLPLIELPDWLGKVLGGVLGLRRWGTGGTGRPGSETNPLTPSQVNALFAELKASNIPFDWPMEACDSRAHAMRKILLEKEIDSRKVWNYASPGRRLLVAETVIGPVDWAFHVAPVVFVQDAGGTREAVIDPSLFPHPVTVEEWTAKQGDPGAVLQHSEGDVYKRTLDAKWYIPDSDDYSRTMADLDLARMEKLGWDLGFDLATGRMRPGEGLGDLR